MPRYIKMLLGGPGPVGTYAPIAGLATHKKTCMSELASAQSSIVLTHGNPRKRHFVAGLARWRGLGLRTQRHLV